MISKEEEYFNELKRAREFEGRLFAFYPYVRAAYFFYLAFSHKSPHPDYRREELFSNYVARERDDIETLARNIDRNLKLYWKSALKDFLTDHQTRIQTFGKNAKKNKNGHIIEIYGHPCPPLLNVIEDDFKASLSYFPDYFFSEPHEMENWKVLAKLAIPPMIDAFRTHEAIDKIYEDKKKERAAKIARLEKIGTDVAKTTIEIGAKLVTGGP